ncbi:hypothetical protein GJ496_011564 [Pomphorhynchus laevis]|nr:hypothetical protein GJ496_011564 [Pomphorhynchus laevis]
MPDERKKLPQVDQSKCTDSVSEKSQPVHNRTALILEQIHRLVSNRIEGYSRHRLPLPLHSNQVNQSLHDDENDLPAFVMSQLYVSSQVPAMNKRKLKNYNITHIVNLASRCPNSFPSEFTYLQIQIADLPTENIMSIFPRTNKFIDDARMQSPKNNVLVHCNAGISRSVSVIIAYLIYKQPKLSVEQALCIVQRTRPCACPNDGFLSQLQLYKKSKVGYTTKKIANQSTIHPSKRRIVIACTQSIEEILYDAVSNDDRISEDGTSISMESYVETNGYSAINFRKLPNCCNARWGSRAIYTLLTYFLCDTMSPKVTQAAEFISSKWEDVWFSCHMYDHEISNLEPNLNDENIP